MKRKCNECNKHVLNISQFSDERALIVAEYDPHVCLYIHSDADNIEWIDEKYNYLSADKPCGKHFSSHKVNCRVIKTARSEDEMNHAADNGYQVLIKKVKDNPEIKSKLAVEQDKETQRVSFLGDYRGGVEEDVVVDWFFYHPSYQSSPVAAYLVPKDIEMGERVYILDLIENITLTSWNQGDTCRQGSGYATWNGTGFDIEPG